MSYYIQCRNGAGVCPDTVDTTAGGNCINDVSDVSGFVKDGQQCISFTRPFNPSKRIFSTKIIEICRWLLALNFVSYPADSGTCDRPIDPTNQNQYIVWGIGSLGETAFKHHTRATSMASLIPRPSCIFQCCTVKT